MWRTPSSVSVVGTGYRDWPASILTAGRTGTSDPTWGALSGSVWALGFHPTQTDEVFGSTHLNHDWKPRTNLEPHVHWVAPTTNVGTVIWGLDYCWSSGSALFGPRTLAITASTTGVAYEVFYSSFGTISGSTQQVGGTIMWRLYRDGPADTYTGFAYPLQFDIHLQTDRTSTSTVSPPFDDT